uniref:G protein-coupled receptor n=1 Tax=Ditylenchus dipsaci TaxID=166011 RepID=A0A915E9A2_9BILA
MWKSFEVVKEGEGMPHKTVDLVIASVELVLDVVAPLPNLYFILLLVRRHDLHNNLRILLGSFSAILITIALTRIPTEILYIHTGKLYIKKFEHLVLIHEVAVMFVRTIIVPLTLERMLATIRSKSYEKEYRPYFGVLAVLFTLLCSSFLAAYISQELNKSSLENGIISFKDDFYATFQLIDVSVRFFIWLICFTVFLALLYYNQRCYAFSRMPNKHDLNRRYQFSENVQANRQLLAIGVIVFICNLHFDFVMLVIFYDKNNFHVEFSQSFDLVLALALNLIPMAAIFFHPRMFQVCKDQVNKLMFSLQPHKEEDIRAGSKKSTHSLGGIGWRRRGGGGPPRALLTGHRLIIQRDFQQNVYFDQLKKSWSFHALPRRSTPRIIGTKRSNEVNLL